MEIGVNILFWVLTSWLIIFSFSISEHIVDIDGGIISGSTKHNDELISFFSTGQPIFALYFYIQFYFTQRLNDKSKAFALILRLLIIALLFLGFYFIVVKLFYLDYIHILWFPSLWYGIFIFYTVVAIAYGLIKAWSKMEVDKRNLEIVNKQAELYLLRSQLHPHFLFNTMNNLLSMVDQVKNPKLATSIDKLSSLLRYVVYDNKSALVPVSKEIQFIQDFSELQLLRFDEDEIDFKLNIIGNYENQLIEMGILLSFVENAFKHGVQPELNSFIQIDIDVTNPYIFIFKIKNSIHPKIDGDSIGGYGLISTKERLELAYPNKHKLNISKDWNAYNVELIIKTDESNNS